MIENEEYGLWGAMDSPGEDLTLPAFAYLYFPRSCPPPSGLTESLQQTGLWRRAQSGAQCSLKGALKETARPRDRFPSEGVPEVTWEVTLVTPQPSWRGWRDSPSLTEGSTKAQPLYLMAGQFIRFILQNYSLLQCWWIKIKATVLDKVGFSFSTSPFDLS